MLNDFLLFTCPTIGRPKILDLHRDSCAAENKKNIMLGYFMTRVGLCYHDEVLWHFMAVGHTRFRPDRGFGNIRKHVGRRLDVINVEEMHKAISESSK